MKPRILMVACTLLCQQAAWADPTLYTIDPQHSFANFTIRHVVAKTSGSFPDVQGEITYDALDWHKSAVEAKINILSLNTGLVKRNEHVLQKPEYLNAASNSSMLFSSTQVKQTGENSGILSGKLTLNGMTREISFPFKLLGMGADPWGGQRIGFEAQTQIRASDYGFIWAQKKGAPVGNDIDITLLIEAVKKP